MSAELEFDVKQFNSVLELCSEETSKTFPEFVNGRALAVAFAAIRNTVKADVNKITHFLGQIATKFSRSKKTGKLRTTRVYQADSVASRIVNARRKKLGLEMIWGKELEAAARK